MNTTPTRFVQIGIGTLVALVLILGGWYWARERTSVSPPANAPATSAPFSKASPAAAGPAAESLQQRREQDPRYVDFDPLIFWWDGVPPKLRQVALATGPISNIHTEDYVGPEACRSCHAKNYEQWSQHPHRHMNALATTENVQGDFFGRQGIHYLGGDAKFFRDGDNFRMQLARDGTDLVYDIRQTIGSRFFQYYIGRLVSGPFEQEHVYRTTNHVLPFGYWLERQQWVPVVHVGTELPDGQRDDPFAPPPHPQPGLDFTPYAANCNMCHTTFPLADDLTRKPQQIAKHAPLRLHWNMGAHFRQNHPELWKAADQPWEVTDEGIHHFPEQLMPYEADEHAVTLGISCEACHLGCKAHAEQPSILPDFHPHSPLLMVQSARPELEAGRTHQNVNWACARCHVGERPQFAAGMSTWNSVEYSDAMLGSCYSQLKCIDCHSPHAATGHTWRRSAEEDDASCVRCHTQYTSAAEIARHTHHEPGSDGSRCMNCHMPQINEGISGIVRTHTIFSPTNPAMIEANHPNACNLCHTDRPIDWTLRYLEQWYGATYSAEKLVESYPDRQRSVAALWMESEYEPVRLVGASAACRVGDRSLLPELCEMLDDPYLINRQFTLMGLENLLRIRLDAHGYQFYMTPEERAEPLQRIRKSVLSNPP